MTVELQILCALVLDGVLGDPRWFPHPVRFIGRLITALEELLRQRLAPRTAGIATALTVIGMVAAATTLFISAARWIHPWLGDLAGIFVLYTTFAARDLANHSRAVWAALAAGDLGEARQRVSRMVGRDTERLSEDGVVRAAVESVAENSVDGVIAPLFFAALGGPVAAMVYKAVNTLDSTVGYKNERYRDFGRTAARIDDGLNWMPARLAAPIIAAAAGMTGLSVQAAWRSAQRDGGKHPSPNSGISEAAFAGALGVRLGGAVEREGSLVRQPELGDFLAPLERNHILAASRLMVAATILAAMLFLAARWGIRALCFA
ncbi:MAG: adenosylcobinamide-phosphate synthase CbiB [Syntrophaceae bacterium]|nr:adenosylcobinamide-phosphate synthase CbiB [Syntrophaceae bacterium]